MDIARLDSCGNLEIWKTCHHFSHEARTSTFQPSHSMIKVGRGHISRIYIFLVQVFYYSEVEVFLALTPLQKANRTGFKVTIDKTAANIFGIFIMATTKVLSIQAATPRC